MRSLILTGLFGVISMTSQSQSQVFAPIKDALRAGSAKELVKHFNSSIDVEIDGDERTYSKAQAELVLRDFFKKHAVNEFNIVHNGSSEKGQLYAIGSYLSGTDKFTVLIRIKEVQSDHFIHEIKFIKDQ